MWVQQRGKKGGGRGPCRKGSGFHKNALTEPIIRSECLDSNKHTGKCGQGLKRGTDHALACRSLHVVNAAQVLDVEENPKRRTESCRRG